MKTLIAFLGLILFFSVSMASATTLSSSTHSNRMLANIHPSETARPTSDTAALIPLPPMVERFAIAAVKSKFRFTARTKRTPTFNKQLPMIGWLNINCYGGTAARFARG